MTIAGSASWSPDGTRLLVRDMKSIVWIHDLSTDQNHPIHGSSRFVVNGPTG
jgi:hypothetical protein